MDGENSGESACIAEHLKSIRHSIHQGLCVTHVNRGDEHQNPFLFAREKQKKTLKLPNNRPKF